MKKIGTLIVFSCLAPFAKVYAQPGKDGARTISAANTIVNEYTYLSADASAGSTSITVNNNNLNTNSRFSAPLAQGDLILIIQMQGASMNATVAGPFSIPNDNTWGAITTYNNAGNYEFAQVLSVSGTNTINILCGLKNDYTAAGHVQVVRVPRYTTLNINNSLTGEIWDGNKGGIVAVEPQGNTVFGGGSINVNAIGFRGGDETDDIAYYGAGSWGSMDPGEGAPKGEGIVGFTTEYTPLNARYARGAPGNAGGGGNAHNCGGGGGGNAGNLATYTGYGIPNPAYNTIWNLETPALGGTSSSGGGRGGHSFTNSNQNANSVPCADPAWGGDYGRNYGGMGGRPLDYSTGRLFFGGGGGSGEQNDGDAGSGGRGAGLVFIMSYGNVSGTGTITANGESGFNSTYLAFSTFQAKDGAGGGGAGGTVVINTNGTTSGITINANGGNGGNQNFGGIPSSDGYGPGGGGGGGYIAISAGTPTRTATGGNNGTSNSTGWTEFPPRGATSGGAGLPNEVFPHYHFTLTDQTICQGETATLTATITGTVPAGVTLNWYASQFSTTSLGTGTSFTTPALSTTTTYYVGFCPGHYRLPVTVTVNPAININTASVSISNETCAGSDGSITGITVSGGTGTLTYEWNGIPAAGPNLTAIGAGTYTLEVNDAAGCSATAGPFTVGSSGGPVINTASMVITNSTCGNNNGSISGITVSGGTGAITYEWNGMPAAGPNTGSVAAGTYTLEATDAAGCTSSAGPFIIGNTGGVTITTGSMVITNASCGSSNGSITGITASSPAGGLTYTWNGTIVTTPTADITAIGAGTYTLVVDDAEGCSATVGPYTITNVGAPVIDVSSINVTSTTCGLTNGSITGITVTGGTGTLTYEWNGVPAAGPSVTGVSSGTYMLEVTDAASCSAMAGPFTINPSNALTATATGTDASCFGASDGTASGNFVGGNGGITYQWIGGPATQNNPSLPAGTYSVIVSDAQGCADTASVTINEPAAIAPAITGTNTICNGSGTTLTASGGGTYAWNTGPTTSTITVSPTTTTTYTVEVTVGGCTETANYTVTVNYPPTASITGPVIACPDQPITLTANGDGTYVWNDGTLGSSITVSPTADTQYYVVANNSCGSDTAFQDVTMGTAFTVDAGPDQTIILGASATISATGGIAYEWTPSGDLSCSNCQTVVASPSATTTYTVTATNGTGCTATDQVTIFVDETISIFVPDIFAPNGNGVNDVLYVRGSGIADFTFRVYDRWGQKVFQSNELSSGWDGTFSGRPLDTGVFVYTLEGNYVTGESFSMKGNVTLKR